MQESWQSLAAVAKRLRMLKRSACEAALLKQRAKHLLQVACLQRLQPLA